MVLTKEVMRLEPGTDDPLMEGIQIQTARSQQIYEGK